LNGYGTARERKLREVRRVKPLAAPSLSTSNNCRADEKRGTGKKVSTATEAADRVASERATRGAELHTPRKRRSGHDPVRLPISLSRTRLTNVNLVSVRKNDRRDTFRGKRSARGLSRQEKTGERTTQQVPRSGKALRKARPTAQEGLLTPRTLAARSTALRLSYPSKRGA